MAVLKKAKKGSGNHQTKKGILRWDSIKDHMLSKLYAPIATDHTRNDRELSAADKKAITTETLNIKQQLAGVNDKILAKISSPNVGTVCAFVTEATLSQESTWSTPFENSNPENRMPSLLGSLQSGVASETVKSLGLEDTDTIDKAIGRSSFTKVNSTQIYVSSQSAQIQLTLMFSAWADASMEVEKPINLLHQMSLPQHLSDQSLVQKTASDATSGNLSLETFLPSIIPEKVTLTYGGRTYKDLVIQNFQRSLSGLMDKNGNLLQAEVSITLVGYQAWDKTDVAGLVA